MRIKDVSRRFNLPVSTLRYYEEIGLIGPIKRVNGIRDYQQHDIDKLEFIVCLKDGGLALETMKEYFDLYSQGDRTLLEREELLKEQRASLLEKKAKLEESLEYLDFKINLTITNIQKRNGKVSSR
ncbi:MAG: MerR family transcriptional regulator [Bacillus sp. (in: firmicutes)]